MRLLPVRPVTDVDLERHAQRRHRRHQRRQITQDVRDLFLGRFEHELVVHLENQLRAKTLALEMALYGDHRELDEIGGRALHRRVDRGALGACPARAACRANIGQEEPPPEYRFDVALLARELARALHVRRDTGMAREIAVDELLRRRALDIELRREAERAHAVYESKIDGLDVAA